MAAAKTPTREAFKITADEFDQQFDKYLKDRFKPFRDKERPADYGRNLGPNPEKTPYRGVYTAEPSPSGDLLAIFTGNRRDGEGDIILVSRKDGSVVRKLTAGFDKDKGFEYISTPGGRWVTVPWLTWSSTGDRLAYFARTEKSRSLIMQDILTGDVKDRIEMRTLDEPESPDYSPDGKRWCSRRFRTASATSSSSIWPRKPSPTSPKTISPIRRRPGHPMASPSSTWRASAATRNSSGSMSRRAARRS